MTIRSDDPRITFATDSIGRGQLVNYKCDECKQLLKAPLGQEGDRCVLCDSGSLYTVSRITRKMLAEAERAAKS